MQRSPESFSACSLLVWHPTSSGQSLGRVKCIEGEINCVHQATLFVNQPAVDVGSDHQ